MVRRAAASTAPVAESGPIRPDDPVTRLEGVGPKRARALEGAGIRSIGDLIAHFPRRYEDRRAMTPLADVQEGDRVMVAGSVVSARLIRLRGRMNMAEATIEDTTGRLRATWFNQGYLARTLTEGTAVVLTGTAGKYKGLALKNPELEILGGGTLDSLHVGRIVPIYPSIEGISQRILREWIWQALQSGAAPEDVVPGEIARAQGFADRATALRDVHFPNAIEAAESARARFAFEELFVLQAVVLQQRRETASALGVRHEIHGPRLAALQSALPFELTAAQNAAIADILRDMAAPSPMARLLQGDVGCGKTMVAMHAVAACVDGGHQAAFMTPTEVLAAQHHRSLSQLLGEIGIRVELLTAASPKGVRACVRSGEAQVVVGTHALFERATEFHDLGLCIVDEQHRFGIRQRERLAEKGARPDCLHLTATPIPRSLAMTVYGAMDLTIVREMPPGRLPVITRTVAPRGEREALSFVRREIEAGQQAYVVCPQVESGKRALADAEGRYRELSEGAFEGLRCGLVHGRLDPAAKDGLVESFRRGEIDVLVCTTVIEVGVDAPHATVIVIEAAGNFGLTQLHQLRGRVGRSGRQSYCFLMGKPATDDAARRLEALCATTDGFEIAEQDFAMRGPGEVHGQRQSGLSDLKAAQLPRDGELLIRARRAAESLIEQNPGLKGDELEPLARAVDRVRRIAI